MVFDINLSSSSQALFAIVLSLCVTIPTIVRLLFLWYLFHYAPKGRPVNALILIEQVSKEYFIAKLFLTFLYFCQILSLTTGFLNSSMTFFTLASSISIESILGDLGCSLFWIVKTFGPMYTIIANCGLAVYRLLLMKCQNFIKYRLGFGRSLALLITGEIAIAATLLYNFWKGK